MTTPTRPVTRKVPRTDTLPSYVRHQSFGRAAAAAAFDAAAVLITPTDYATSYMPDDVTRDHARRMHYAAHRLHAAKTPADRRHALAAYFALRDAIVLGNRKLIYRAVRRRMALQTRADDMIGECHIVLIQAVAAYNPWLGIRFSTYAYTCLVRALSRQAQRLSTDWLERSMPLDALPDGEPANRGGIEHTASGLLRIDEFLRDDHPLLTDREKSILNRRYCLTPNAATPTLEHVGAAMGLSKERVRQVQAAALVKLRTAILDPESACSR